jgi:3-isopropylmalate/(R)-2-methylmalate dehydratase small subunit
MAAATRGETVTVDLAERTLTLADGTRAEFPIESFARHCLLNGVDQLGFLLEHDAAISSYEHAHPATVCTTGGWS